MKTRLEVMIFQLSILADAIQTEGNYTRLTYRGWTYKVSVKKGTHVLYYGDGSWFVEWDSRTISTHGISEEDFLKLKVNLT